MDVWDGLTPGRPRLDSFQSVDAEDFPVIRDQILATQAAVNEIITPLAAVPSPTGAVTDQDDEAREAIDLLIARLVAKGILTEEV